MDVSGVKMSTSAKCGSHCKEVSFFYTQLLSRALFRQAEKLVSDVWETSVLVLYFEMLKLKMLQGASLKIVWLFLENQVN